MGIKHSILIYISISIVFLIATTSIVSADEIYVYPEDSIQAAVNDAVSGDTIIVYPGIYSENMDVNKSITIKSKSGTPDDTIIRAANSSDHVFHVTANSVAINGFTITGAFEDPERRFYPDAGTTVSTLNRTTGEYEVSYSSKGMYGLIPRNWAGVYVDDADSGLISDNLFLDNNRGILLNSASNNILENNTAINNDGAIRMGDFSNSNIIRNNSITADVSYVGPRKGGIGLSQSYNNEIYDNTLLRVDSIGLYKSDTNKVFNNTMKYGGEGIFLCEANNNEVIQNSISNYSKGIFLWQNCSSNKLINNTIFGISNGIFIEAYSNNNTIAENTLKNGNNIVFSDDSNNNNIYENKIIIDYSKYLKKPYIDNILLIVICIIGTIYLFILLFRK